MIVKIPKDGSAERRLDVLIAYQRLMNVRQARVLLEGELRADYEDEEAVLKWLDNREGWLTQEHQKAMARHSTEQHHQHQDRVLQRDRESMLESLNPPGR